MSGHLKILHTTSKQYWYEKSFELIVWICHSVFALNCTFFSQMKKGTKMSLVSFAETGALCCVHTVHKQSTTSRIVIEHRANYVFSER